MLDISFSLRFFIVISTFLILTSPFKAQPYPTKPVRIISPYSPGCLGDLLPRALANSPSIVLADEPTVNLDLKTGKEIIDLLRALNQDHGVTVISATHDTKMLDVSDRVFHISDGELSEVEVRAGA